MSLALTLASLALAPVVQSQEPRAESRPAPTHSRAPATRRGPLWTSIDPGELHEDQGALVSGSFLLPEPAERAVLSWNATFEPGSRADFELRVRTADVWSKWFVLGRGERGAEGPVRYASVKQEPDAIAGVDVDTLAVNALHLRFAAFQVRVRRTGAVTLRSLGATWYRRAAPDRQPDAPAPAWGRTLDVPTRSQNAEDPKIARRICSPTALSMSLAFLGAARPTAEIAARVHDPVGDVYGNWSANAAVAGELLGEAFAVRALGFAELEEEIAAGRPVVLSHSWKEGELTGAPLPSSSGHLIVVVGFTKEGDLVVNDPAADPDAVRRVYRRDEIWRTWQENASGIVYLFRPRR